MGVRSSAEEGNGQRCPCTVQAEAPQSCRPASRPASEQTADAPGASAGGRRKAVRRQQRFVSFRRLHHERAAAARDGGEAGGDTDLHPHSRAEPTLTRAWALVVSPPLETVLYPLFLKIIYVVAFGELSQGAGKLQTPLITGDLLVGCSGAGSSPSTLPW